jgi:hypothetical protein
MKKVSVEEFIKKWNSSSKLGCQKLRGYFAYWLYPLPEDLCKSGDCRFITCHNYRDGFDESHRLIVPEKPLPDLMGGA